MRARGFWLVGKSERLVVVVQRKSGHSEATGLSVKGQIQSDVAPRGIGFGGARSECWPGQ